MESSSFNPTLPNLINSLLRAFSEIFRLIIFLLQIILNEWNGVGNFSVNIFLQETWVMVLILQDTHSEET